MPRLFGHHIYYLTLNCFNVVYNRTLSVTLMFNNLNWPLLQQRRDIAKIIMFYKIMSIHELLSSNLHGVVPKETAVCV